MSVAVIPSVVCLARLVFLLVVMFLAAFGTISLIDRGSFGGLFVSSSDSILVLLVTHVLTLSCLSPYTTVV